MPQQRKETENNPAFLLHFYSFFVILQPQTRLTVGRALITLSTKLQLLWTTTRRILLNVEAGGQGGKAR